MMSKTAGRGFTMEGESKGHIIAELSLEPDFKQWKEIEILTQEEWEIKTEPSKKAFDEYLKQRNEKI